MGRKNSSALGGSLSRDGVSKKTLVGGNHKHTASSRVKCQIKEFKITELTGLEPLVVKVSRSAYMGYLIRPQQVVIKQRIKQKRE